MKSSLRSLRTTFLMENIGEEVYEEQEQTLALLKLLALGNKEIKQGKFRDVEDIFNKLDEAE